MIEIEKKVRLTAKQLAAIERTASFIEELHLSDIYFDAADFRFTKQKMWLRQRDGLFELKCKVDHPDGFTDHYEELSEPQKILKRLQLSLPDLSVQTLSQAGIIPFCKLSTCRKHYRWEPFTIHLDIADFGDFTYPMAEVELQVAAPHEIERAEKEICTFLERLEIDFRVHVPTKLTYYLYHKRPEQYQALVESKSIKPLESN